MKDICNKNIDKNIQFNFEDKNKVKENKFAKGTFILLIGGIICKLIGAFYRVPLSNILGAEGIGVYQLIFPIYSLFLIVASGGIPVALSKITAECRARGEIKRSKRFLFQSIILLILISIIFSIIFLIFGDKIASLQGNRQAGIGYIAVGVAIVFASILTAFRGYFQGYQNMIPTAVSQIVEQVLKLILGLTLASFMIKNGIEYGVLGAMLGVALSEAVALVYLIISYCTKRKKTDILEPAISIKFWNDFRILLKKVFPLTLNALILPLILAVDSFLIVNLLLRSGLSNGISTQMFGVYSGMVNSLINFPTVVSLALAVSLIPAISYERERGVQNGRAIESIFKIILLISIPCFFIYLTFSREIILILYPSATSGELLELGSSLLRISAINIFYISLLQVSTAILQANNNSVVPVINLVIAGMVKIILTIFFVLSPLNIYGAAIGSVMCFGLASGLNLLALKKGFNFYLSLKNIFLLFLSSLIMIGIIIGFNLLFNLIFSQFLSILFSLFIGGTVYLILIIIFPIFNTDEILKIPFGKKIIFIRNKLYLKNKKLNKN